MRRFLPILLCCATASSCGEAGARASGSEAAPTFAALFDSLGTITLEENQATINVAPIAAPDPAGGFVVVDAKELRGRLYDGSGKLVGAFGRDGKGPGEFTAPMSGRRAPSGEIVVADAMEGRITYFDPTGTRATGTSRVPLLPLYDAVPRGDSALLLVGRAPGGFHAPLLHLFDRRSGKVEHSFFPTPGGATVQRLAGSLGWADAAVRGDTVATTFGMSDTLYLFGLDGALRKRIPLPFRSFALPEMPDADERNDPRAQRLDAAADAGLRSLLASRRVVPGADRPPEGSRAGMGAPPPDARRQAPRRAPRRAAPDGRARRHPLLRGPSLRGTQPMENRATARRLVGIGPSRARRRLRAGA